MKTNFVLLGARISFASRESRRWLVVLVYAGFAAAEIAWFFQTRTLTPIAIFVGFLSLLVVAALAGTGYEPGDEREEHRRDHAFYKAHRPLAWVLVAVLFIFGVRGLAPVLALASPALRAFLDQLPYAVLFAGAILYATLPQAILLWTEPDLEDE
jgi:uncharacterized membrane protein YhaH (DUF805 family)